MDLSTLQKIAEQDEEVVDVVIRDRSNQPYLAKDGSKATIGVFGSESATYKKRRLDADRKAARSGEILSTLEIRRLNAACGIARWHGWEAGGEPLACNLENVAKVLAFDHILYQVEGGIARRDGGFSADESGDSSPASATAQD
jgi:hypothetical protein